MKRGSALLMAIVIIATLSVMVISFVFEAQSRAGINIYVREKKRVMRLVEAGRILGEVVMLGYKDATAWSEDEDVEELLEKDRWYREKRDLKGGEGSKGGTCTIGPILLDEEDPDSGTVTVKIESVNNESNGININELYNDSDETRWQLVYNQLGIREDDGRTNFKTKDGIDINLQQYLIYGWMHFRGTSTTGKQVEGMSEAICDQDYEDYYEDHEDEIAEEDRWKPAHGPIATMTELSRVLCFQEYPAVLTGGVINPWEDKEDQITIPSGGLLGMGVFGASGTAKVNVNHCSKAQLLTVPGIVDEADSDDEDALQDANDAVEAILKVLKIKPEDSKLDDLDIYPYKSFTEMLERVEEEYPDVEISQEASQYLTFTPDENTVFKMTIVCESMGMQHTAECECYVSDKKIRYVSWKEN